MTLNQSIRWDNLRRLKLDTYKASIPSQIMDQAKNLNEIHFSNPNIYFNAEWKQFYQRLFERCKKAKQSEINVISVSGFDILNALKEYFNSNENPVI